MAEVSLPGLRQVKRGKVRHLFHGPTSEDLLIVASDRVSAFDVVFNEPVPWKGHVLSQLTAWWFEQTRRIVENHLVTSVFSTFPNDLRRYPEIKGRSMCCRPTKVIPIECVVRGYLDGSAWKEYEKTGRYLDHELPPGLKRYSRLPEPIFTPATKAEVGHDENITYDRLIEIVGPDVAAKLRDYSLALYSFGATRLDERGIVLVDTKFEYGEVEEQSEKRIILIDELFTPDSSRFWVKQDGVILLNSDGSPSSYDKQLLRDYLEHARWNKQSPPPMLPVHIIEALSKQYLEIFERIIGRPLDIAA